MRLADTEIRRLNPLPAASLGAGSLNAAATIVPDFFVYVENDQILMSLNKSRLPGLRISESFQETVHSEAKGSDAYVYAKERCDAATTFIETLRMREQALKSVMGTIIRIQRDFFLSGDDESQLKPMALKDIAESVKMSVSTVSRVANSKYVQTEYATYPLKFFFAAQTMKKNGEEVSNRELIAAIKQLVDEEDKTHPLTDDQIVTKMKAQGYTIARRTVAKYRTQLGIPSSQMRR